MVETIQNDELKFNPQEIYEYLHALNEQLVQKRQKRPNVDMKRLRLAEKYSI